jgi:signal transduction histidine kinase
LPHAPDILAGFIHEMENSLQVIKGSLDFLRRDDLKPAAVSLIETGMRRTDELIRQLEEFVSQPGRELSGANPAAILKELRDCMEHELRAHKIRVNLCCNDALPDVWINPGELRRVVQTVIDFSRVLLPRGGELRIEAGLREREGDRYIELVVSSRGAVFRAVTEENVFRPVLEDPGAFHWSQHGFGTADTGTMRRKDSV